VVGALLGLSGCAELTGGTGGPGVTVSRNAITIAGPRGFCVDPITLRDTSESAFVLLGNCAAILGQGPQPRVRAILTATVRDTGGVSVREKGPQIASFLSSEPGRALLSRRGRAEDVEILETRNAAGVLYLHASDSGPGYAPGMSEEQWRAIFDLRGAVVSLTVVGFQDTPLSQETGIGTLQAFAKAVKRENSP